MRSLVGIRFIVAPDVLLSNPSPVVSLRCTMLCCCCSFSWFNRLLASNTCSPAILSSVPGSAMLALRSIFLLYCVIRLGRERPVPSSKFWARNSANNLTIGFSSSTVSSSTPCIDVDFGEWHRRFQSQSSSSAQVLYSRTHLLPLYTLLICLPTKCVSLLWRSDRLCLW